MWPFTSQPRIPVLRLTGTIGMAAPLRPSLSVATVAHALETYVGYRDFSFDDDTGADYEDLAAVLLGARWRF